MNSLARFLLALITLFGFAISANSADTPEIRGGSLLDFRPYSFTDKDGQPTGFGVELMQAVAEKATLNLRISLEEWDKVWNKLVSGEIDVLPVVARTPSREALVEFTLPHTETFDAFFVRAGQPPIRDLAAAADKEIVVLRSDAAHHQLLDRKFPGKIVPVDSIPEGLRLIASGKHDAMLCSRLIGVLERDQAGIKGVTDGPVIPDYKRVFSFAVRKGNTDLVERLNQGLRLVQADGTYDRLYRKWLGVPTEALSTWWDYFWQLIAAIGMLFLLAVTLGVGRKVLQLDSQPLPASVLPALQPRRTSAVALRFAMAPLTVAAAFIVQSGLLKWIGAPLPHFLLFYPAVMGVAVIAGLWPGLLAMALAVFGVGVWIMEPIGQLVVKAPADLLALAIFCFNCLLMCAVAQLYRRSRSKAAAHERDAAVRESEERLRLLGDNLPDSAVYQYSYHPDGESKYLYVSAGIKRVRGVSAQDVLSNPGVLRRQILPEYVDKVNEEDQRSIKELSDFDMDIPVHLPNGQLRWVQLHSRPRRTPDGRTIWDGVQTDITGRKASEEALHRHSTVLRAINHVLEMGLGQQPEEEMCQAFLDIVEEFTGSRISFIGEIGSDGSLHDLAISNPGWDACEMYDQGGLRKPPGNFPIHGIYGRVLSDGKSLIVNDPLSHPDRIGLPQGHPPLTAFLGVPLMREGKVVGMIAAGNREGGYRIQDQQTLESIAPAIVEALDRKRAEEELRQLNENLEKLVQERTEKLRRLASELTLAEQRERKNLSRILHDGLQQYLVAAKMQLNSLHARIGNPGRKQEAQIIEHLLDEAVQVSRSLAAELSPPILRDAGILAGLEWLSRWMHEKHCLKVQLIMEMDAPVVAEDVKILLFESVREMLLNVVKHAETKFTKIHLFLAGNNEMGLTVSDNGRGFEINPENLGYHQGFGLFSIQERLSFIGGKLEIDSALGKGSRLTMTAPLGAPRPLDCSQAASTASVPIMSQTKATGGRIKILLVDDHAVMREGLSRLLSQEADFEVVGQAANGQEAIEKSAALKPDCILMDVSMPVLGGIEATEVIHRQHSSIRIIGLSLYTEDERAKEMLAAGASFYMSKSGPPSELISAIRSCCGRERDAISYLRKDQATKLN